MLINWFTVCAQMINFLILVWLLKRYLYKPVLVAIDSREKSISDKLALATSTEAAAKKSSDDFLAKSNAFEQSNRAILQKVVDDAGSQRQKLLDQTNVEFDALRRQQKEALDKERVDLSREIVRLTCQEVFSVARKTLSDLSTVSLEASMAAVLVERVNALGDDDRSHLADSLKDKTQMLYVKSTFELPVEQQQLIVDAANQKFAYDRKLQFETAPDLVCGIELSTEGYRISWSIADYLNQLSQVVTALPKVENAA